MKYICICLSILIFQLIDSPFIFAQEKPIISFFDFYAGGVSESTKKDLKKNLEEALRKSDSLKNIRMYSVDLGKLISLKKRKKALAELEEAKALYKRGKKLYENLDLNRALQELLIAEQKVIDNFAYVEDAKPLLKIHLYIGLSYIAKGIENKAYEEFSKMLKIDPNVTITKRDFAPSLVKKYLEIRKKILESPQGKLTMSTHPKDALIFINGVRKEKRKIRLHASEHYIRITKNGFDDYFDKIDIPPNATIKREITLEALSEKYKDVFKPIESADELTESRGAIFKTLADINPFDFILLGSVEKEDEEKYLMSLQIYDMRTNEYSSIFKDTIEDPSSHKALKRILKDVEQFVLESNK